MTSSNIPDFLSYSATRHASDIFIIAGRPLSVKIDGKLSTYGEKLMPADTDALIRQIYQLANNRNIDPFLNTGDDDFSFSVPGLSRFRVNAYRQRGSLAAVIRVIAFELPNPDILHIPEDAATQFRRQLPWHILQQPQLPVSGRYLQQDTPSSFRKAGIRFL